MANKMKLNLFLIGVLGLLVACDMGAFGAAALDGAKGAAGDAAPLDALTATDAALYGRISRPTFFARSYINMHTD